MKKLFYLLGLVMLVAGVAGYFMKSPLLGYFEVNTFHNIVHIISGILLFWAAAQGENGIRSWSQILGIFYGIVTVYGFFSPDFLGLMMLNTPDNILHVVLTLIFLYFGFAPKRTPAVVPQA